MTSFVHVAAPGLLTTIQDRGRVGYQNLGVPVSGALDPVSLQAANLLVGNPPDAGALEVACVGPTLVAEADSVRLAVAGANATIEILPDATATAGQRVAPLQSFCLRRGEALRIGALTGATVLYVAVEGSFDIAPVLGSVSTDIRGGLGGWHGRALAAGDRLPLRQANAAARGELCLGGFSASPRPRVRVIKGPQDDHFPVSEVAAFLDSEYTVGPSADRMGMRLTGRALKHSRGFDIASDGIAPGSIQVPGNGAPIVLLADRQTTGGYPKIATVIAADLPALARLPVGSKVSFEAVTIETAQNAYREHVAELAAMREQIVPLRRSGSDIEPQLLRCNLVSGFIDAAA
ncbi:MAG: biotin-dependent carboxyltransferase family protein [Xanthobacteraceae bacterium]|nr:biotin-dependent carboxyltransferase family protein [Xanthobacteraceae bacterium]